MSAAQQLLTVAKHLTPQSLEAEQAILGAILGDPAAIDELDANFSPAVFYRTGHAPIYAALRLLIERDGHVDLETLADHLRSRGELDACGGTDYLGGLAGSYYPASHVKAHAAIVVEKYRRRALIHAAAAAVRMLHDETTTLGEVEKGLVQSLDASGANSAIASSTLALGVREYLAKVQAAEGGEQETRYLDTGYAALDRTFRVHRTDFVVVGGRPMAGKSVFALGINLRYAMREDTPPAVLVNLEMSREEVVHRALMATGGLRQSEVERPTISSSDRVLSAADKLVRSKLVLLKEYDPDVVLRDATRRARKGEIGLLSVDFLHLFESGDTRAENLTQRLGQITRRFRRFSLDYGVPVIMLSALRRLDRVKPGTAGSDCRPTMHDLRDSGNIESDATGILLVHSPGKIEGTTEQQNGDDSTIEIIVAKQRTGPAPRFITLHAEWDRQRIVDPESA